MLRNYTAFCVVVLVVVLCAAPATAWWEHHGVAVCTEADHQQSPCVVNDGSGGVIIAWADSRYDAVSDRDVYAQRLNANGVPQWTPGGVVVCAAAEYQANVQVVSDGSGGAIIIWEDRRTTTDYDIYAQRIDHSGVPQWVSDGVAICTVRDDQYNAELVSDGNGGAIVAWRDTRNDISDVFAQRVDASGTTLWAADGIAVCAQPNYQLRVQLTSDGSGGAIITWHDERVQAGYADIYAQRVDASGLAQWTANGVSVCSAVYTQTDPEITSDDSGGAVFVWRDVRYGSDYDIYAQRLNSAGAPQWTIDGVAVCIAPLQQEYPEITSDGGGGAVFVWRDLRNGSDYDIYAQRLDSFGTPLWRANGVVICAMEGDQLSHHLTGDGTGGAIFAWRDQRDDAGDLYAQRVDAAGVPSWTNNGLVIAAELENQASPRMVSDGNGGALIAWQDGGGGLDYDIYAQSIDIHGNWGYGTPVIHSAFDVPGDQGGLVNLEWDASLHDPNPQMTVTEYTLWRALGPSAAASMAANGAKIIDTPASYKVASGDPLIRVQEVAGTTYYWSLIDTHVAYRLFAYSKVLPTLFDSTAVSDDYHYFQVIAHSEDPYTFWISPPDSGYSVDNLPPEAPQGLAGQQTEPEAIELSWLPNSEADLSHYHVYRGTDAGFTPVPGNRIGAPDDPALTDDQWRWDSGFWYKVTALDEHGNESLVAVLGPEVIVGAGDDAPPLNTYLAQNYPNPFNPSTTIAFGVEGAAGVTLQIFDATGRLVRTLADQRYEAGRYEAFWDGRDTAGRSSSSGVYFCRLTVGERVITRKMVLLK